MNNNNHFYNRMIKLIDDPSTTISEKKWNVKETKKISFNWENVHFGRVNRWNEIFVDEDKYGKLTLEEMSKELYGKFNDDAR